AHPEVAVAQVPGVAGDVADLDGLREIGRRLGEQRAVPEPVPARG
ncbi:MAG: ArsA family ATPase, partial [Pseudonocardiales bacterium]|nr:ArsA family ATPase [Pseudonocardiales bacterium]